MSLLLVLVLGLSMCGPASWEMNPESIILKFLLKSFDSDFIKKIKNDVNRFSNSTPEEGTRFIGSGSLAMT